MSVSTTNNPTGHEVTIVKNGPHTFGKTTEGGTRASVAKTGPRCLESPAEHVAGR